MTYSLGKRRRRDEVVRDVVASISVESEGESHRLQSLLKQHFEATFDPLPTIETKSGPSEDVVKSADEEDDDNIAWDGIGNDDERNIEMVQHDTTKVNGTTLSPKELKAFMSSRPPLQDTSSLSIVEKPTALSEGDEPDTDQANLRNDLALQRLLRESKLMQQDSPLSNTSQKRGRALDLSFQDVGAKSSLFVQPRMPLAQRKGIAAKAAERQDSRRREAQENGIILEKARKTTKTVDLKRQRSVGAPSVGKFRGGMLTLSKKDLHTIQGPKRKSR